MARIKAKPMNRLPIAPVSVQKINGYRSTPPPTAVFDPSTAAAYPTPQQRFIYPPNGPSAATAIPNVPSAQFNQVQMIPAFQHHQFWPAGWTTAPPQPNYFDLTVFPGNGLTPQIPFQTATGTSSGGSTKSQNPRYNNGAGSGVANSSSSGKINLIKKH